MVVSRPSGTAQALYDVLDFQRACQMFLRNMMGAVDVGVPAGHAPRPRRLSARSTLSAMIHLDAAGLLLTGNSETI